MTPSVEKARQTAPKGAKGYKMSMTHDEMIAVIRPWTRDEVPRDRPLWVKKPNGNHEQLIDEIIGNTVYVVGPREGDFPYLISLEGLFLNYVQHDGTPCGVLEARR